MVFTNDLTPRAKVFLEEDAQTLVRQGASIGANASIRCGVTVGALGYGGPGECGDPECVPDYALAFGAPARQQGWVCACGSRLNLLAKGKVGKPANAGAAIV